MNALLASFLVVAAFAGIVHRYAPKPGERWGILLERYRPHAPMSDWSVGEYDGARQYADLAAVAAHQERGVPAAAPRPDRRRPGLPDIAAVPCRQETVQF
ncbi:hypothetical protein [Nocardia sp. NPDC057668]|uniref:hypothetical protein n=1 Tax=Nocardia sp. NPDC057668 TaxID=3346202 RepID=UPI003672B1B7